MNKREPNSRTPIGCAVPITLVTIAKVFHWGVSGYGG